MTGRAIDRRTALAALAAGFHTSLSARGLTRVRIGIMDGIVGRPCQPEAVAIAAKLGFQGVQITLGKPDASGRLTLANDALQEEFRREASELHIELPSTYLDVLHVNCLKNDPLALNWIDQGIKITKALGSPVLMLVFFGSCALDTRADMDSVVAPLKTASRRAEHAGITLGFENTISAADNARILEQVGSPALKVWYDIGNSTNIGHFDVPNEIRFLGRKHICQFHIKDKTYLGQGAVQVQECVQAIADIGFEGFVVLETAVPTGNVEHDAAKNLAILRQMMAAVRS
jgi:L-ribulose-5-phosphate 3-epimerase